MGSCGSLRSLGWPGRRSAPADGHTHVNVRDIKRGSNCMGITLLSIPGKLCKGAKERFWWKSWEPGREFENSTDHPLTLKLILDGSREYA